ncbi:MAG: DedA family protein [Desulfovibrio sp.]|nr:DedA family protein [Desulfovibrio sp.]MBI4960545.1 DedA family protein [Desulfovibrio sp.]
MTFVPTELLSQYGYAAVFLGCLVEGETILLLAGFAAHQGYLSFPLVAALAVCGGALGDQIFFFIGRKYGQTLIDKYPRIKPHVDTVNKLIIRFHSAVIILVRFMYGLRVAGPVAIGASGVGIWRFMVFNLLGAALWALLVGGTGYVFGQTLGWLFSDLKHYEELALVLLAVIAVVIFLFRRKLMDRRERRLRQT